MSETLDIPIKVLSNYIRNFEQFLVLSSYVRNSWTIPPQYSPIMSGTLDNSSTVLSNYFRNCGKFLHITLQLCQELWKIPPFYCPIMSETVDNSSILLSNHAGLGIRLFAHRSFAHFAQIN